MAKKMNGYNGRTFAADANAVEESTLIKVENSMVIHPQLIGSYYKNRKQIHNLAYWTKVIADQDVEKLAQLKQA